MCRKRRCPVGDPDDPDTSLRLLIAFENAGQVLRGGGWGPGIHQATAQALERFVIEMRRPGHPQPCGDLVVVAWVLIRDELIGWRA